MNQATDSFAGKTDEELRGNCKTYVTILAVVGIVAVAYALFLLYSAASGNWSRQMGIAVVPLLAMIVSTLFPMTRLAATKQELTRRHDQKNSR